MTASGSDVALVRRMLSIDDLGDIILSPLVETIQIRHFSPAQSFYEFELDRASLFAGTAGGLLKKTNCLCCSWDMETSSKTPYRNRGRRSRRSVKRVILNIRPSLAPETRAEIGYQRRPQPQSMISFLHSATNLPVSDSPLSIVKLNRPSTGFPCSARRSHTVPVKGSGMRVSV